MRQHNLHAMSSRSIDNTMPKSCTTKIMSGMFLSACYDKLQSVGNHENTNFSNRFKKIKNYFIIFLTILRTLILIY